MERDNEADLAAAPPRSQQRVEGTRVRVRRRPGYEDEQRGDGNDHEPPNS